MQYPYNVLASALSIGILAGCGTVGPTGSVPSTAAANPDAGRHLVYRDPAGSPTMQFDYPDGSFCRKVEEVASRNSRCEKSSADDKLMAKATLRYEPPGMEVVGHYPDMASCEKANSRMAMGVKLTAPCRAK